MLNVKFQNSLKSNAKIPATNSSMGLVHSRSHSMGKTLTSWSYSDKIDAIGVDLESKSSSIKRTSERLFLNGSDNIDEKNPLIKWCIKEACFKAMCNYLNAQGLVTPKLLLDITVRNKSFHFHAKQNLNFFSNYIVIEDDQWVQVFAVISTKKELLLSKQDICVETVDNNLVC